MTPAPGSDLHRGRLRAGPLLIPALLALPGGAVHRAYGPEALGWAAGWVGALSILTYLLYAADKRRARVHAWRISEGTLHLFALLGGWPGAFLAQSLLRHKSAKGSFRLVFILIIGLHQFIAIEALRGWPLAQAFPQ